MSEDIRTQQRWLIAGVAILAVLLILVIVALIRSLQGPSQEPQVGGRSPAEELAYCAPEDSELCIVSFGQIEGGDMLVNFQLPRPGYPAFILVINRFGVENTYVCRKVKGLATGVTCTGASQAPGEVLQFRVFAKKDGTLLAEGKFAIIGIAIATPEGQATETLEVTATQAATRTPTITPSPMLPTATGGTPTATPTLSTPSYPNPSYP